VGTPSPRLLGRPQILCTDVDCATTITIKLEATRRTGVVPSARLVAMRARRTQKRRDILQIGGDALCETLSGASIRRAGAVSARHQPHDQQTDREQGQGTKLRDCPRKTFRAFGSGPRPVASSERGIATGHSISFGSSSSTKPELRACLSSRLTLSTRRKHARSVGTQAVKTETAQTSNAKNVGTRWMPTKMRCATSPRRVQAIALTEAEASKVAPDDPWLKRAGRAATSPRSFGGGR
jgi:hypothetical protein